MTIVYSKPVTGSQLVAGLVGTIDMGSLIAKVVEYKTEEQNTSVQLDALKTWVDQQKEVFIQFWQNWAGKKFEDIKDETLKWLLLGIKNSADYSRSQVLLSALGYPASASMLGLRNKLYTSFLGIDTLTDLFIGIPQTIVARKAERYYNKQLAPEYPNERDAFMLYRLGKWDKAKFINMLRETEGISASDAENITEIREWQTGKPSLRDAWYFVQKGYKPIKYFYDLATKGFGWTVEDANALFKHYYYDPSFSELLRLSDLIPLESSWIDKKLTALGLNSEDKPIFKAAIEKRVIRDEINKAWSYILDAYQWGLFTEKDITDLLSSWNFTQEEIKIRIQTGELLKTKLRVKLLRDAEIYLYRKGTIDEETLLTRLVNLGISKDIANAIVRNEAAKKGLEWEIPSE